LDHATYRHYLLMHKMSPGEGGARRLEAMAGVLSAETDPLFLSAAASAYLESGIVRDSLDVTSKLVLAGKAEMLWEQALRNESTLGDVNQSENDAQYRIAMNLACLPMVRAMFTGDVMPEVIDESIEKLIGIGDVCGAEEELDRSVGRIDSANMLVGVQHEINALISLMYRKDPRFIAIPSFHRAGTGYYYPEQTHDIELISQHYGKVRHILPIEVKARMSNRTAKRYRAMLVGARVHLGVGGSVDQRDPSPTRQALNKYRSGEATDAEKETVLLIQSTIGDLISEYKKSGKHKPLIRSKSQMSYYKGAPIDRYQPTPVRAA